MQSNEGLPRCQYTECRYGHGHVKYDIAHMAFCSQECHDNVMVHRYSSAGILPVSMLNKEPSIYLGSDKNRRRGLDISDPASYGLEIFGGARDKDMHAEITANREFREESGINIDPEQLGKYLAYAPVIVKPFIQRGKLTYYVVFIIHIEQLNTISMNLAWQARLDSGARYECIEMDQCYQVVNRNGTWEIVGCGENTKAPTICKYHLPVIARAYGEGYLTAALEFLPSVNSLGIWKAGGYLTQ